MVSELQSTDFKLQHCCKHKLKNQPDTLHGAFYQADVQTIDTGGGETAIVGFMLLAFAKGADTPDFPPQIAQAETWFRFWGPAVDSQSGDRYFSSFLFLRSDQNIDLLVSYEKFLPFIVSKLQWRSNEKYVIWADMRSRPLPFSRPGLDIRYLLLERQPGRASDSEPTHILSSSGFWVAPYDLQFTPRTRIVLEDSRLLIGDDKSSGAASLNLSLEPPFSLESSGQAVLNLWGEDAGGLSCRLRLP